MEKGGAQRRIRCGLLARKVGMIPFYKESGEQLPATVLDVTGCQVVAHRTQSKNGYVAVQLGAGARKHRRITRPEKGNFAVARVAPKQKVAEFRVSEDGLIPVGAEVSADHFAVGQFVDVTATSIGKGFSGGMKRWNFGGLRASHGVSISHRSIGSTGGRQDPGRTFKQKKMPGQLGGESVTVQNLEVLSTDPERGIIIIKGAVPGPKEGWVKICDAKKKSWTYPPRPFPGETLQGPKDPIVPVLNKIAESLRLLRAHHPNVSSTLSSLRNSAQRLRGFGAQIAIDTCQQVFDELMRLSIELQGDDALKALQTAAAFNRSDAFEDERWITEINSRKNARRRVLHSVSEKLKSQEVHYLVFARIVSQEPAKAPHKASVFEVKIAAGLRFSLPYRVRAQSLTLGTTEMRGRDATCDVSGRGVQVESLRVSPGKSEADDRQFDISCLVDTAISPSVFIDLVGPDGALNRVRLGIDAPSES
jgi:large subunit ribosomal protein L3